MPVACVCTHHWDAPAPLSNLCGLLSFVWCLIGWMPPQVVCGTPCIIRRCPRLVVWPLPRWIPQRHVDPSGFTQSPQANLNLRPIYLSFDTVCVELVSRCPSFCLATSGFTLDTPGNCDGATLCCSIFFDAPGAVRALKHNTFLYFPVFRVKHGPWYFSRGGFPRENLVKKGVLGGVCSPGPFPAGV